MPEKRPLMEILTCQCSKYVIFKVRQLFPCRVTGKTKSLFAKPWCEDNTFPPEFQPSDSSKINFKVTVTCYHKIVHPFCFVFFRSRNICSLS